MAALWPPCSRNDDDYSSVDRRRHARVPDRMWPAPAPPSGVYAPTAEGPLQYVRWAWASQHGVCLDVCFCTS